ncbi:Rho family small GTP binding protein cdc42 [Mycena leptocephala]|nr:Rho family small GTP binding protein cdc42 [Mycena leptocephala]
MNHVKLVIIGDHGVGKTSMCISFTTGKFPYGYIPTFFDSYADRMQLGTKTWMFGIFDTAGSEEYDRLRPLSYPQTDIFLVCFSVGLPPSFEHVKSKWVPEAHHHCPGTPFVLVATQIDLRADEEAVERMARDGKLTVSVHQGQRMARELGAAKYVECSAKTLEGVKDVFDQAIAVGVAYRNKEDKRGRRCIVL